MSPGRAMRRREAVTEHELMRMVRSLGPRAWERFGDVFAFDLDILMSRLPPSTHIVNGSAPCLGTICLRCCKEAFGKRIAKRVTEKGVWDPCDECGGELARVYEARFTKSDLIRILFPWSGARAEGKA